jgi:hypothetical protein
MRRFPFVCAAALALAVAAFAAGQNADQNTAGPTKNDYRLRVVQPLEGAKVIGDTVQVVIDTQIPAERDTRQDVNSMPRPAVDIFLDDLYKGTMRSDNVIDLKSITPGPHEIVVLAKNLSGEIIDRKVIHILAVAPPAPVAGHRPAPVVRPAPAPAPPAPAYEPPPAPPAPEPAQEMPKTATNDALLLVIGIVLVVAGVAVRRFA